MGTILKKKKNIPPRSVPSPRAKVRMASREIWPATAGSGCRIGTRRSYYRRSPERNPVNDAPAEYRVLRGGGWLDPPASRARGEPQQERARQPLPRCRLPVCGAGGGPQAVALFALTLFPVRFSAFLMASRGLTAYDVATIGTAHRAYGDNATNCQRVLRIYDVVHGPDTAFPAQLSKHA